MAERTALQTMVGATLAISASLPATYDAAGYAASSMTYTTCGQVENFGDHGPQAQISTFTAINDAVVQKFKGAIDYGLMNIVVGHLPSDAGQGIIETASHSTARYSVKLTYPLGSGESTAEIHYLDVLVASATFNDGDVNNVRKRAVSLAVCRKPIIVDAT